MSTVSEFRAMSDEELEALESLEADLAALEAARAADSMRAFTLATMPGYVPARHHQYIVEAL